MYSLLHLNGLPEADERVCLHKEGTYTKTVECDHDQSLHVYEEDGTYILCETTGAIHLHPKQLSTIVHTLSTTTTRRSTSDLTDSEGTLRRLPSGGYVLILGDKEFSTAMPLND